MMHKHPLRTLILPLVVLLHSESIHAAYTTTNNSNLHDNNPDCNCYVVGSGADSNTPSYFQYYRFFDFRNLADRPNQYLTAPPLVNDTQNAGQEPVWTPSVFNSDAWNTDWGIQNWSKPATSDFPTPMVNSPANVYILQNNDSSNPFTWLTLRTSRLKDFQSAGEIENNQMNVMHASLRMYGRVRGAKGACAGFFTFFDDSNESDIEILTDDPTSEIRYTNQPSVDKKGNVIEKASITGASSSSWSDWQTHRIDWLPKHSYWYLNQQQVAANTYSIPRKASYPVINMWSDGGSWSGNMSLGDSAEFHIQWIEMAFNTSGPVTGPPGAPGQSSKRGLEEEGEEEERRGSGLEKRKAKGCEVVCKVDSVKELGHPEVVSVNKSAAADVAVSWGVLVVVGVVAMVVGL